MNTNLEKIIYKGNDIQIDGVINEQIDNNKLYYIAAAPADYRGSFSGSGMPFYNEKQAYDNTPNVGNQIVTKEGAYSIKLVYPNAYYNSLEGPIVNPHIKIYFYIKGIQKNIILNFKNRIPFRDIRFYGDGNYRKNVNFYNNTNLPVRSQEDILISAQYPSTNTVPPNFWGYKPAL